LRLYRYRSWGRDHDDRAGGVVNATGTDRAQYDGGDAATSAPADHEHVGVQRFSDEGRYWAPLDQSGANVNTRRVEPLNRLG
jgi:hypothetical protein